MTAPTIRGPDGLVRGQETTTDAMRARPERPEPDPAGEPVVILPFPQAEKPVLLADRVYGPEWPARARWQRITPADLPIVVYDPAPLLSDPIAAGEFVLWADATSGHAFFALTAPRLHDFSLTVQRRDVDGTLTTTGATATMTVSAYPLDPPAALEQQRGAWTEALALAGQPRLDWRFQPLDLRTLTASLELAPEHRAGDISVTQNAEAGTATFLFTLSAAGAVAWRQALIERQPQSLQGICRLQATAYQQAGAPDRLWVGLREVAMTAPLGVLAAGLGPESVQVVNPEQTVDAVIVVVGHPTVDSVVVEMRTPDGSQTRSAAFDSKGGQLRMSLTVQSFDDPEIQWTAQVAYQSARWQVLRQTGRLNRQGWAAIVKPSSWVQSIDFTAMLLDGAGTVVSAASTTAVDLANRVHGDLSFTAPFLDGSGVLQTSFETSSQQQVIVYYPAPPGLPAGQMKLSVYALRDGRDDQEVRVLEADETMAVAKVYANARIELFTNGDPAGESSEEAAALGLLGALRHEGGPRPETGTRPDIAGPLAHDVTTGPPSFEVRPGDNPFYVVEVATRAELFDTASNGGRRDETNFFASDADGGWFLSGPVYQLPDAAWQRLRGAAALSYRIFTSASDQGWVDWDVSTPDGAYFNAPSVRLVSGATTPSADLRSLLGYLDVPAATFAPRADRYFERLRELLADRGVIDQSAGLDQDNFRAAVHAFQERVGASADGIPGEDTLWELQADWADTRDLEVVRVDADVWLPPGVTDWVPDRHGFDHFMVREDAARRYEELREEVLGFGAVITSAGAFRDVAAAVTAGRSATSFHYSGLALDLSTPTGMRDPEVDPYIVTQDGDRWRVWARASDGTDQELDAVVWADGEVTTKTVQARVIDFTALAEGHGFARIGPRGCFPGDYLCAEWWHFQCDDLLTPWVSQFGIELLSLRRYDRADLEAVPGIWQNRKLIFRRGRNGWR
jgi:hypothetical protein